MIEFEWEIELPDDSVRTDDEFRFRVPLVVRNVIFGLQPFIKPNQKFENELVTRNNENIQLKKRNELIFVLTNPLLAFGQESVAARRHLPFLHHLN